MSTQTARPSDAVAINPDELPGGAAARFAYSFGVRRADHLWISGQVALDPDGAIVGVDDIAAQAEQVFRNIGAVLAAAGGGFEHLVATTTYMTDRAFSPKINEARLRHIDGPCPPTSTLLVVAGLARPEFLVEISGVAVLSGRPAGGALAPDDVR